MITAKEQKNLLNQGADIQSLMPPYELLYDLINSYQSSVNKSKLIQDCLLISANNNFSMHDYNACMNNLIEFYCAYNAERRFISDLDNFLYHELFPVYEKTKTRQQLTDTELILLDFAIEVSEQRERGYRKPSNVPMTEYQLVARIEDLIEFAGDKDRRIADSKKEYNKDRDDLFDILLMASYKYGFKNNKGYDFVEKTAANLDKKLAKIEELKSDLANMNKESRLDDKFREDLEAVMHYYRDALISNDIILPSLINQREFDFQKGGKYYEKAKEWSESLHKLQNNASELVNMTSKGFEIDYIKSNQYYGKDGNKEAHIGIDENIQNMKAILSPLTNEMNRVELENYTNVAGIGFKIETFLKDKLKLDISWGRYGTKDEFASGGVIKSFDKKELPSLDDILKGHLHLKDIEINPKVTLVLNDNEIISYDLGITPDTKELINAVGNLLQAQYKIAKEKAPRLNQSMEAQVEDMKKALTAAIDFANANNTSTLTCVQQVAENFNIDISNFFKQEIVNIMDYDRTVQQAIEVKKDEFQKTIEQELEINKLVKLEHNKFLIFNKNPMPIYIKKEDEDEYTISIEHHDDIQEQRKLFNELSRGLPFFDGTSYGIEENIFTPLDKEELVLFLNKIKELDVFNICQTDMTQTMKNKDRERNV